MKADRNGLRTWIEINRAAARHNLGIFKKFVGTKTKLMAVVKSNAYGHNLVDFSLEMEKDGADFLGVDSVVEALALRKKGVKLPILVLGYTLPEKLAEAAREHMSVTASNFEMLESLAAVHKDSPIDVHVKVDTGMHRQGFQVSELKEVVARLTKLSEDSHIRVGGLYTHFAAAKNPAFPQYTRRQLAEFTEWSDALSKVGFKPIRHAAATAGAILFPESHLDMVRIGIGLYGHWPSAEVKAYAENRLDLKPVLSWKSVVAETKRVSKGEGIGYDLTEHLDRDSTIAVLPIGYWHGYPRTLSSIGRVIIKGVRCRVLGRVSMDMIVVDITDAKSVVPGDEVVLIGEQKGASITAEEMGMLSDTVNYEIITRLNPLIKRLYV